MIYLTPTIYHRSPRKPIRQWLTSNKSGNISKVGVKIKNIINANSIRMSVRVRLVLNYMCVNQRPKGSRPEQSRDWRLKPSYPTHLQLTVLSMTEGWWCESCIPIYALSLSPWQDRNRRRRKCTFFYTTQTLIRSTMLFSVQYSVKHSELWQPS